MLPLLERETERRNSAAQPNGPAKFRPCSCCWMGRQSADRWQCCAAACAAKQSPDTHKAAAVTGCASHHRAVVPHQVCALPVLKTALLVELAAVCGNLALTLVQAVRQVLHAHRQHGDTQCVRKEHRVVRTWPCLLLQPARPVYSHQLSNQVTAALRSQSPGPLPVVALAQANMQDCLEAATHTCSRVLSAARRCCSSCSCLAFLAAASCCVLIAASCCLMPASRSSRVLCQAAAANQGSSTAAMHQGVGR